MELNQTHNPQTRFAGSGISRKVKPWLTSVLAVLSFLAATNSVKAQPPCTLGSNYDLVFFSAGATTHGGIGLNVTPAGILTQFRNGGTVPIADAIPPGLQNTLPNPGGGPSTLQFAGATSGNVTFDFCHAVTNPVFYIHGTGILGSTVLSFPVPVILEDDGAGPNAGTIVFANTVTGDANQAESAIRVPGTYTSITVFITRGAADPFQMSVAACTPVANIAGVERVVDIQPAASCVVGNFDVTLEMKIQNLGNTILINPQISDLFDVSFLGAAYVGIAPGGMPSIVVAGTDGIPDAFNPGFDGTVDPDVFIPGTGGSLDPGEMITIQVTIEVDPNAVGFDPLRSDNFLAQGTAACSNLAPSGLGIASDDSDSGAIAGDVNTGVQDTNPGEPGDTGADNDPTPLLIQSGHGTKEIVSITPAASNVEGNYDVTYHYVFKNTGNVDINFAEMQEAIDVGIVAVVSGPTYTGLTTATLPPAFVGGYDGIVGSNEIVYSDGGAIIEPSQILDIEITFEVDPDGLNSMMPNPDNIARFRYASNDPLALPATPGIGYHEDISDSGNDPESSNDTADGASTVADDPCANNRTNDPTPSGFPDIRVTKEISSCVDAASGVAGNLDVTFHFVVQNTGNVPLTGITVIDYLDPTLLPFLVGITVPAVVTNIDATSVPDVGAGYTGVFPFVALVDDVTTFVEPAPGGGQSFEVTFTAEFDANNCALPAGLVFNQAFAGAFANYDNGDPVLAPGGGTLFALDESDSGNNPLTDNPDAPGDGLADMTDAYPFAPAGLFDDDNDGHDTFDHPTPLALPNINITKEITSFVPSASGIPGNYDVTFHLIVQNTGNIPLDRIDLEDDFAAQLGVNFVQILSADINEPISTAYTNPVVNGGYDGGLTSLDVFDQTSGYIRPCEFLDIDIVAELNLEDGGTCIGTNQAFVSAQAGFEIVPGLLDPLIMPNGMIKIADDLSDHGNVPDSSNPGFTGDTGGSDDPTPIEISDIRVVKAIVSCVPVCDVDPCATGAVPTGNIGNYAVTIQYTVKNTGSVDLNDVQLEDFVNPANNLGVICEPVIVAQNATVPAAIDASYDGVGQTNMFFPANTFACGESITVEVTFEFDPNGDFAFMPYDNTAFASGNGGAFGSPIDASDTGFNPDDNNDSENGAIADQNDDPTRIMIPALQITKEVTSVVPAASGTIGNFDVTFHLVYQNVGNVPLEDLALIDFLAGMNPVAMVAVPFSTGFTTATTTPVFDNAYDGNTISTIFDGTSGLLNPNDGLGGGPGELVDVEFTVELNAEDAGLCAGTNVAIGSATGLDPDGNQVIDPFTGAVKVADDLSDSGNVPEDPNDAAPGASAGGLACEREDDATPVSMPDVRITKALIGCVSNPDPCSNTAFVTFQYTIKNTGNQPLTNLQMNEGLDLPNYIALTTAPAFVFSNATTDPTLNAGFDGDNFGGDSNVFDGVSGQLDCGQIMTIEMTFEFDPNSDPAPYTNFATISADSDGDAILDLFDLSDDGFNPDTNNDNFTEESIDDNNSDPTLIQVPRIKASKEIVSIVPAASGIPGNFDVFYGVTILNTGNVPMNNLELFDVVPSIVGVVAAPTIFPFSNATTNPILNNTWDGNGFPSPNIFDGTSGLLDPGQVLGIGFTVEINAEDFGLCAAPNQAFVTGQGLTPSGNVLLDPVTLFPKISTDLTDAGFDPAGNNPGQPGDTGGCDDPTLTPLPSISVVKAVVGCEPVCDTDPCASGDPNSGGIGNYAVTLQWTVKNNGNTTLTDVQLFDGINTANFVGLLCDPVIVFQDATGFAAVNPAYDGENGSIDAMLLAGNSFDCGQTITLQATWEFDPNGDPLLNPYFNSAIATGDDGLLGTVTDISDSGFDNEDPSDGEPGAIAGQFDDPTLIMVPSLHLTKEVVSLVPAASGVLDNWDVTFHIILENTGNVDLENIAIDDDLAAMIGPGLVAVTNAPFATGATTATTLPVFDPGFPTLSTINITDGTSGLVAPGEIIDIEFTVEVNPNMAGACSMNNQASASASGLDPDGNAVMDPTFGGVKFTDDLSDSGNVPESPNDLAPGASAGGLACEREDDVTPVPIPDIALTKEVIECVPFNDGNTCTNTMKVTFHYILKNTGNTPLNNLQIFDALNAPANLGGGLVSVLMPPTISGGTAAVNPTVNAGFNGTGNNFLFSGLTGLLNCGQQVEVTVMVQIDPNAPGAPIPMTNQASGSANVVILGISIADLSDSGNDPDTTNDDAPGATPDNGDDPTPVYLPSIAAGKEVVGFAPAASGTIGNFDVSFRVLVENTGNVDLDNIQVEDLNIPGVNWVSMIVDPFSTPAQNSTIDPVYEPGFFGTGFIYDGTSGLMEPGQFLEILYTVEMDANAICSPTNQVEVSGRGLDADGNPVIDPMTGAEKVATDLSDGGPTTGPNTGAASNTGGCDDPTRIEIPEIHATKEVVSAVQVADPSGCTNNYTVTFRYVVENTGSIPLTTVQLFDQLNAAGNLGAGFINIVSNTVNSGPAVANAGYTGLVAAQTIFNSNAPLACGSQIVATVVATVNADLTPVPADNQATASAGFSTTTTPVLTGTVIDLTDSGNDPESPNDAAPGASTGGQDIDREDDATPVYLPKIKASKDVLSIVPASSGTVGNFDVSFRIQIQNTGNVPLHTLRCTDLNIPGINWVSLVVDPFAANFITLNPVFDPGFFHIYGVMFDGNDSQLDPNQTLDVRFTAEMNADAICQPTNQVSVSGAFTHPTTGVISTVSDLSDGGSNPNSPNTGAAGNTGGCNDVTPIEVPDIRVTKEVQSTSMVADPTGCSNNYNVVFKYTIENTGSIPLNGITLTDQLNAAGNLGAGFVSVSNVTVVSGPATAVGAFTGTSAVQSAITQTGPLACNSQIMVTITAIANADLVPVPTTNQANVAATWTFTNTPPTVGAIIDASDSGNVPDGANYGAPGATDGGLDQMHEDDATPVYLPKIKASKDVLSIVPASSGTVGNFDVSFRMQILNTGNVPLTNLSAFDLNIPGANWVSLVIEPNTSSVIANNPTMDPGFFYANGSIFETSNNSQLNPDELLDVRFTLEMNADAICQPTNQVLVGGDFVHPVTGAITNVTDFSDGGSNPNSPNTGAAGNSGGCNDATPIEVPDIRVTKEVQSAVQVVDPTGCTNNYNVTFKYTIENTGSIPLTGVTLTDQFNAAGNLGAGFVSVSNVTVVSGPAAAVGGFTGTSAVQSAISSVAPFACNTQIMVTITAIVNADLTPVPATNQANVAANWTFTNTPATTGSVNDASDSGNVPDGANYGAPGATSGGTDQQHEDDPTPVYLPKIKASKDVLSIVPASSGTVGNFDVSFRVQILNTGNVPLTNIWANDLNIPGVNWVSLVVAPNTQSVITNNPTFDPGFFYTNGWLFENNNTSILSPDQLLDVRFTVEMNADAICQPTNQVNVVGDFIHPITGVLTQVSDLSDGGSNPNSPNTGAAGNTGGCNDATPIEVPDIRVTKEVQSFTEVVDPTGCSNNYNLTYKYTIENTGSIPLTGVTMTDQLNTPGNLGAGFVSLTNVTVVSGPAVVNGGYTGANPVSAITATGPLSCNQQIMLTITVVVNPDLTPLPTTNQSFTAGTWAFTNTPATIGVVVDISDSGNVPDGANYNAPGATSGGLDQMHEDDPTPTPLPRIKAVKRVVAVNPAASGIPGNFDVEFEIGIQNTGNIDLDRLTLTDNLALLNIVGMPVIPYIHNSPLSFPNIEPVFNPGYTNPPFTQIEIFDGTSGLLVPDSRINVRFVVEINAENNGICASMQNQATATGRGVDANGDPIDANPATAAIDNKIVSDLSDNGTNVLTNNGFNGCDDPTPVELPHISATKEVVACTPVVDPSGCSNDWLVTFKYRVKNTGNKTLNNVSLFDDFDAPTNLGAGFVPTLNPIVMNMGGNVAVADNPAFTGTNGTTSAILPISLDCGQTAIFTIQIQVNAMMTPVPATNQATATGIPALFFGPGPVVSDLTDSGDNPDTANNNAPGATPNNYNDPTPVYLPTIKASKEVVDCGPAESCELGNMDMTMRIRIANKGNVPLKNICLVDDIAAAMGNNTIIHVLDYGHYPTTTASVWPIFEPGYDGGIVQDQVFDCTSGLLLPGEIVDIWVTFEINPNAVGAVIPALNQASVSADGVLWDWHTLIGKQGMDLSDGGSDPASPNTGYPGNTGGCNDATPISLPQFFVAKEIIACVPTGVFDPGDFNVTFKIRIENTGNVRLRGMTAMDAIGAQIGAAFEQVITAPVVVNTNVGAPAPTANAAFNGVGNNNLLTANNSILNPGGTITITWTAKINPNALLPNTTLSNQISSTATGLHPNVPGGLIIDQVVNDPQTGQPKVVADLSDSGSIPESYNLNEPGNTSDTGSPCIGEDDPTPIEIPSINLSKKVITCMPSGNDLPGMFDIAFRINVENTGNVNLDELILDDNIFAGLGAAYVSLLEPPSIVNPPLLWLFPPTLNSNFNGTSDINIFNLEYSRLDPGQAFSVEFKIRVNPNANLPLTYLWNQAYASGRAVRADGSLVLGPLDGPGGGPVKRTNDLSDHGFIPESLNPGERGDNIPVAGTHNNPTPLEIPSINVAKYVVSVTKIAPEIPPGNARLTYDIKIENTGNVELKNLMLEDAVRSLMGTAWLAFAPGGLPSIFASTALVNPTLNAGYTGLNGAGAMIFNGTTGRLMPGQTITIRTIIDLDPNAVGIVDPLKNWATGKGAGFNWLNPAATSGPQVPVPDPNTGGPGPKLTTDLSDSGKVPESNNPGEPCDMGTHDDPTPFEIPFILASKWEIPNLMGMTCAASGIDGNIDITFLVKLVNVGNTNLDQLQLTDNLLQQFGSAFVKVIPGGLHIQQSTAMMNPTLDWTYNGNSQPNILKGNDGLLKPNQFVVIRVMAEINPNAPGAPKPYDNQAMVMARAMRKDGTLVFVPCTTNTWIVDDKSDGGDNPETVNAGWPGDTGGSNDPFDFRLPMTMKFPTNLVINPSCDLGIDDLLLPWFESQGGAVVVPAPGCGPMTWTSNFMGSLAWLPADTWSCGCSGTWTIRFMATDECGHDVCFDPTVTVVDNAPPCWDMFPMDKTVVCGPGMTDAVQDWLDAVGGAWFFDVCSTELDVWNDYNPGSAAACDEDGTKVTFFLRDECGNVTSASAILRIIDEDAPTFLAVPANVTINCGAAIPAAGNVVAIDDCTSTPAVTLNTTTVNGSCFGTKVITRTWTAQDLCGNVGTAQQTITVIDVTKPTFTSVPPNLTITCPATPVFGTPVATDICSGTANVTITFTDAIILGTSCPTGYTVRRTWTATDLCGNTRTVQRTIKVLPDPNPNQSKVEFTVVPTDQTIQCTESVIFGTATATSTCPNPTVTLTFVDSSIPGSCTTSASFIRTWTATDGCGNTKTAKQVISQLPDASAPTFATIPVDVTVDCGTPTSFGTPVCLDNCTAVANLNLTWTDTNNSANCSIGQMVTKTRFWTLTDGCGLTANGSQTITELPFSSAMAIASVPSSLSIDCGQTVQFGVPVITSTCPVGTVTMTSTDNSTGGGCNDALFTRTWIATDACGNTLTVGQTITVKADKVAPNFTAIPGQQFVDCNSMAPASMAAAIDNCSSAAISYTIEVLGSNPCVAPAGNVAIIHWVAVDACGNTATAETDAYTTTNVTGISFISKPQVGLTYECGEPMIWTTPLCVSGCSPDIKLSHNDVISGECATGKTVTRTWTATDPCGNVASQTVVQSYSPDAIAPVMVFTSNNEVVECGEVVPELAPDVTDNCSVASVEPIGDSYVGNKLFRTWQATDDCGNTSTGIQIFIYQDTEAPTFLSIPSNQTIQCGEPVSFGGPSVTDACGNVSISFEDETVAGACAGESTIIRTWKATDAAGNITTAVSTIFVKDDTKPVFVNLPVDQLQSCDAVLDIPMPNVTDCSGATVTFSDILTQGQCTGDYIITRTWTATDGCGNVAVADAKFILVDDIAPTFDANSATDQTMTFNEFANWTAQVGATDNCGLAIISQPQTTQVVDNCELTYAINWTATDDCGNFAQHLVNVQITDEQPSIGSTVVPTNLTTGENFTFEALLNGGVAPFSYSWTITGNGWFIAGGENTTQPIVVAGNGPAVLTLTVTNGIGCVTLQSWDLDATSTGITDLTAEVFVLFPVPTMNDVNVRYTLQTGLSLEFRITDESGKLIDTRKVNASAGLNLEKFDLTKFAAGNYLLEIKTANGTSPDFIGMKPFVKQ